MLNHDGADDGAFLNPRRHLRKPNGNLQCIFKTYPDRRTLRRGLRELPKPNITHSSKAIEVNKKGVEMDAAVPSKVGLLLLLLSSSPLLECSRSWSSSSSSTSFACLVVTLRVGRLFISSTGFMDRKAPVFLLFLRKPL